MPELMATRDKAAVAVVLAQLVLRAASALAVAQAEWAAAEAKKPRVVVAAEPV